MKWIDVALSVVGVDRPFIANALTLRYVDRYVACESCGLRRHEHCGCSVQDRPERSEASRGAFLSAQDLVRTVVDEVRHDRVDVKLGALEVTCAALGTMLGFV